MMSYAREELVFSFFKAHDILYINHSHEPLFTVQDSQHVEANIPGAHCKNIFLKSKSGKFILVVMLGRDRLNLKIFEKERGFGKLSFASPEQLLAILNVTPGSVTPFALLHSSAIEVKVFLDQEMMSHELLNYHPLRNDMTTTVSAVDFLKFLKIIGQVPTVIALPKMLSHAENL